MNIWKRNAVVATVVLFVCVALYLSWSYSRTDAALEGENGETVFTTLGTEPEMSETMASPSPSPLSDVIGAKEPVQQESTHFTEQRLNRQKARDSALSTLKDLASQDTLSEEERKQTNEKISVLATQALTEAKVEGLIVSKGFADCVVYIGDGGINVVVAAPTNGLTATDVVKIQDIIVGETEFTSPDIRIMEAGIG